MRTHFRCLLLGAAAALTLAAPAAHAQLQNPGLPGNWAFGGYSSTVVTSTASTTSPVDAAVVSFTPHHDPNAYSYSGYYGGSGAGSAGQGGNYPLERLFIDWSADVTKATGGAGYCGVYVNGALVASSDRTATNAAGESSVGGSLMVYDTVTGAQNVKVQCASSDTSTLTINNVQLRLVEEYR